jgi:hypothetical protein
VLVKRYLTGPGSQQVRTLLRRKADIAVSRITEAEAHAAVARAARMKAVTDADRDRADARHARLTVFAEPGPHLIAVVPTAGHTRTAQLLTGPMTCSERGVAFLAH